MHATQLQDVQNLRKRLDEVGWAIFLIMIGTIALVPSVPQGTWLIGTGVLLLVLNVIRFKNLGEWSGFSTTLGVLALAAGLSELLGIKLPLFAVCMVVLGVAIMFKSFMSPRN